MASPRGRDAPGYLGARPAVTGRAGTTGRARQGSATGQGRPAGRAGTTAQPGAAGRTGSNGQATGRAGAIGPGHAGTGRPGPRWGRLPARTGILLVVAAVTAGLLVTVLTGGQPGFALGALLVVGTLAAVLAVRPRAVYRLIPVPALAYVAASLAAVLAGGPGGSSRTALALSLAQALASGFYAMIAATGIALAGTLARRPRGPAGPFSRPGSGTRPGRVPPGRDRTAGRDREGGGLAALGGLRQAGPHRGPWPGPPGPRHGHRRAG